MKNCPYCLVAHEQRGAYCCPEHAAAAGRQRARGAGKTKRATAKVVEMRRDAAVASQRWRDIAMGRNTEQHLSTIFPPGKKKKKKS